MPQLFASFPLSVLRSRNAVLGRAKKDSNSSLHLMSLASRPQPALDPAEADVEGKIFLGGLTWQTTEDMLRTHFGKWGETNDVILMRNKITGEPRGFGFVQFQQSSCECFSLLYCFCGMRCLCGIRRREVGSNHPEVSTFTRSDARCLRNLTFSSTVHEYMGDHRQKYRICFGPCHPSLSCPALLSLIMFMVLLNVDAGWLAHCCVRA